ncbi:HNH endonuclease [Liberiplasma polymorphum]|uniref:HNH endonuclease n=1 Tax=Liberiplasma polymorphum TaxID=3374570 RepID=UPI003770E4A1
MEYHGTKCRVCGFDFYEVYGERGEGFIEIHHKKPLYKIDGETIVDPKYDLVPLCSNCHRMIHRIKDDSISVEDLDRIVRGRK